VILEPRHCANYISGQILLEVQMAALTVLTTIIMLSPVLIIMEEVEFSLLRRH
jgi:hypothetical protein